MPDEAGCVVPAGNQFRLQLLKADAKLLDLLLDFLRNEILDFTYEGSNPGQVQGGQSAQQVATLDRLPLVADREVHNDPHPQFILHMEGRAP